LELNRFIAFTLPIKDEGYSGVVKVRKRQANKSSFVPWARRPKRNGVTRSLDAMHASREQADASSHVPV